MTKQTPLEAITKIENQIRKLEADIQYWTGARTEDWFPTIAIGTMGEQIDKWAGQVSAKRKKLAKMEAQYEASQK